MDIMEVRKTGGALGAEIIDVDCAARLDANTIAGNVAAVSFEYSAAANSSHETGLKTGRPVSRRVWQTNAPRASAHAIRSVLPEIQATDST